MNGIEFMLIFAFLAMVFIFFAKVANVMTMGRLYGVVFSWVGFGLFILFYLVNFALIMYTYNVLSFTLVRIATFLLVLLVAFHFFEVFYTIKEIAAAGLEGREVQTNRFSRASR